ncbi:hypothetical protein K438DRAFT_1863986 [Mycena galopus ATCC 62051]|nr:hypothetical protein K438DRAFT_1863986 [Mycena galopus ATCC 62051]
MLAISPYPSLLQWRCDTTSPRSLSTLLPPLPPSSALNTRPPYPVGRLPPHCIFIPNVHLYHHHHTPAVTPSHVLLLSPPREGTCIISRPSPVQHHYTTCIHQPRAAACLATATSSVYPLVSLACSSHASRSASLASPFAAFSAFVLCYRCCGFILFSFVSFCFRSSSFFSRVPSSFFCFLSDPCRASCMIFPIEVSFAFKPINITNSRSVPSTSLLFHLSASQIDPPSTAHIPQIRLPQFPIGRINLQIP